MNVEISYDSALLAKNQHDSMKSWHASMATQHSIAAEWHLDQSESLSKAIQNIPLDPEKIVTTMSSEKGQSTGAPGTSAPASSTPVLSSEVRTINASGAASAQLAGASPRPIDIPLDPVKKADLVEILKQHVDEFGSFGKSIEEVVDSIFRS